MELNEALKLTSLGREYARLSEMVNQINDEVAYQKVEKARVALWESASDGIALEFQWIELYGRQLRAAIAAADKALNLLSGRPDAGGVIRSQSKESMVEAGINVAYSQTFKPRSEEVASTNRKIEGYMAVLQGLISQEHEIAQRHMRISRESEERREMLERGKQ